MIGPRIFARNFGRQHQLIEEDGSVYKGKLTQKEIKLYRIYGKTHPSGTNLDSQTGRQYSTTFTVTEDKRWFDSAGKLCKKPKLKRETKETDK